MALGDTLAVMAVDSVAEAVRDAVMDVEAVAVAETDAVTELVAARLAVVDALGETLGDTLAESVVDADVETATATMLGDKLGDMLKDTVALGEQLRVADTESVGADTKPPARTEISEVEMRPARMRLFSLSAINN